LCARFRAANPATHFDPERSHKWLQGRALPRSRQVYDDWVKVLGTSKSATWIADCPLEDFLAEVHAIYGVDRDAILQRAEFAQRRSAPATPDEPRAQHHLCGPYACYSHAWSPYYEGNLIRGALLIGFGTRGNGMVATYTEALLGDTMRFEGEVLLTGRTVHLILRPPGDSSPLFQTLMLPGPPASVMCGIMSGATVVGHEPQPSATRIVVVRVRKDASASNRYMRPPELISSDLAELGLPIPDPGVVDEPVGAFLGRRNDGALDQVSASEQARLAAVFDRLYLAIGAVPAENGPR
jgi:hypothetical protein